MIAGVRDNKLCFLEFDIAIRLESQKKRLEKIFEDKIEPGNHSLINEVSKQLDSYFEGKLKRFSISLDIRGTDFQIQIWKLLTKIPFGETITYGELARRAGDIKKVRAVGGANGENHIAIIIPCHRVIGANGSLVGYGGEVWRKKKLLDMERMFSGKAVQAELEF